MFMPNISVVNEVKEKFQKGARVQLVFTDDPFTKLKKGDKGTVSSVDDIATVHVRWDSGSGLGMAHGIDIINLI